MLALDEIAPRLVEVIAGMEGRVSTEPEPEDGFEPCSGSSAPCRGFDFTGYKRPSLRRRDRRAGCETLGIDGFEDYQDYLEVHPEEFPRLFDTILINVTIFFRDPPAWEYLAREVVPRIAGAQGGRRADARLVAPAAPRARRPTRSPWCCAEALGAEAFRERVKIYATDVDDEALAAGPPGQLHAEARSRTSARSCLQRYFEAQGTAGTCSAPTCAAR